MAMFGNILVAVDISEEAERVIAKAKDLADKYASKIWVVHIVEPIVVDSTYDLVPVLNADIENSLVERSKIFLNELAKKYDLDPEKNLVSIGSVKAEIHQTAKENDIDLIMIGSHGRHGFALLLGSTANSVLHGAPCDVFCVKMPLSK